MHVVEALLSRTGPTRSCYAQPQRLSASPSLSPFASPQLSASLAGQAWTVLLTNYITHEFLCLLFVSRLLHPQRCITDRFRHRERVHPHLPSQENTVLDHPPSPLPYHCLRYTITPFTLSH